MISLEALCLHKIRIPASLESYFHFGASSNLSDHTLVAWAQKDNEDSKTLKGYQHFQYS